MVVANFRQKVQNTTPLSRLLCCRISNPTVAGPAIPYNRDYKRKYEFLKSQLKRPSNVPNKHDIKVRRAHLLEDSFRSIMNERTVRNVDVLKTKVSSSTEALLCS